MVDNYSTHKSQRLQRWLKPKKRKRFHFHFCPHQQFVAESSGTLVCFDHRSHDSAGTSLSLHKLERAIYLWLANWNNDPKPFVWKATAEVILDKVRATQRISWDSTLGVKITLD